MLDRLHKSALYFKQKGKREGQGSDSKDNNDRDPMAELYGTSMPADIPESTGWWQRRQRDVFAMSDDAEHGLMQAMVTVTHNDTTPEMHLLLSLSLG